MLIINDMLELAQKNLSLELGLIIFGGRNNLEKKSLQWYFGQMQWYFEQIQWYFGQIMY